MSKYENLFLIDHPEMRIQLNTEIYFDAYKRWLEELLLKDSPKTSREWRVDPCNCKKPHEIKACLKCGKPILPF